MGLSCCRFHPSVRTNYSHSTAVFGQIKRFMMTSQDNWMRNNPGKTMAIYDLPGIAKKSWQKVAQQSNLTKGFEVSGVFPFNNDIFTDVCLFGA